MSKKSSGSKRSAAQPSAETVFFVDRCLGKGAVATALRSRGLSVEIHDDHFAADAADEDWLAVVGSRGWTVLTKDKRIRRRPIERNALIGAGVRAFVLTAGNLSGDDMAELFVRHLNEIKRLVARRHPPFIATITRGGMQLYYPAAE